MGASRASVGFLTFLLAFILREQGEGTRGFAIAVAAAGVGGLLGAVVAPALRRMLPRTAAVVTSLLAMAVAAAWASFDFSLTEGAVVSAIVGFGSTAGRLAFDSLVQRDAPEQIRGRTFARYETIFQLCWVAGASAAIIPWHARGGLRVLAAICLGGVALSIYGLVTRASVNAALPPLPERGA